MRNMLLNCNSEFTFNCLRASKMSKREKGNALRWEEDQIAAINSRLYHIEELSALGITQVAAAEAGHAAAVIRGNIVANNMKESMRSENEILEAHHAKRIENVLALKESTALSRKEVKDSAGKLFICLEYSVLMKHAIYLNILVN